MSTKPITSATTLYSLNKDELIHLISMVEKNRNEELEKEISNLKKILCGHQYELQICKDCDMVVSIINGHEHNPKNVEMITCAQCSKSFCELCEPDFPHCSRCSAIAICNDCQATSSMLVFCCDCPHDLCMNCSVFCNLCSFYHCSYHNHSHDCN
jgi:hypothetical protein